MANPWSIPAAGWMVVVTGWLLSPIINLIVNKLFACLVFDAAKELRELELDTVPALRVTLRKVEEQRMVWDDHDGSRSDLEILDKMDMHLKSALYQAEDILDLANYHLIEKELTAGGNVVALCVIAPAASLLLQFLIKEMKQKLGQLFAGRLSHLWRPSDRLLPSVSQATSDAQDQNRRASIVGWCSHLVASITSCCQFLLSRFTDWVAAARYYRDWSYRQVGIKSDQPQIYGNVPIAERIRLRKQIKGIEDSLTSWKKLDLLNQNRSSSTAEDNDKQESCSVGSVKHNISKQKDIDSLYRTIEQKVFGRDKDREHISRMLREGPDTYAASSSTSKPYSVIGIHGITGFGKSTLAQYVCAFEKDSGHFNPIMFIHVGKTFSLGDIFRSMLEQITQSRPPKAEGLRSLKTELEKKLREKCFLLVLDDLWVNDDNQRERDILLDALKAALRGSRIIVTAQKKDAAEALGAQEQILIPDLDKNVYLSLFMHHALRNASDDNGEYKRVGSKIANRLRRSPIAAVTVGNQLQRNKNISFWETTANLDVLNKTMGALWWSYQQLGADIRRCFAYFSTLPRGYVLEPDELVHMWIGQGFVNTRNNTTEEMENIGKLYFDELLKLSFLQVQRTVLGTKVFRIHDLLHELAERVAGSDFLRVVSNGWPKLIPPEVRHVYVSIATDNREDISQKILELVNIHTLIIKEHFTDISKVPIDELGMGLRTNFERLFMRLTKLRVLIIKIEHNIEVLSKPVEIMKGNHELEVFEGLSLMTKHLVQNKPNSNSKKVLAVPECIDQMKHLRYLCIHFHGRAVDLIFPCTFSKLYNIQTIDVPSTVASCPQDMTNLISLRHISAPLSFPNIGVLTSLQTLECFVVKDEEGYRLKQLMHLNKLGGTLSIQGLGIVESKEEALEAHLSYKEQLRKLKLMFGRPNRGPDVEAEVVEGLCPPKNLRELSIWFFEGSRYPSWMLSRHHPDALKQLHKLELIGCSQQLAFIPEDSELFIGLRELCIQFCNWDRLPENMQRLVSLQTLSILGCNKIELLPTLPKQSLRKISINGCHVLSKTCKEEGHENWRKIQQIPEKNIW